MASAAGPAARLRAIVYFLADDLGWHDAGSWRGPGTGEAKWPTPHINALAASGLALTQHYVQPVCSPSRVALHSGQYPFRLGLTTGVITNGVPMGLPLGIPTLPERLRDAGWDTALVGKWDLGMHTPEYTPLRRGYAHFMGFYGAAISYWDHVTGLGAATMSWRECFGVYGGRFCGGDFWNGTRPLNTSNYSTSLYTREALRLLKRALTPGARPLFLLYAHQAPHSPLEVPSKYLSWCPQHKHNRKRAEYCGLVRTLDRSVQLVTRLLQAEGALEDTLLILTTDNGGDYRWGASNYPLRGTKFSMWEGGVRGVAMMSWPRGMPGGRSYSGLMHLVDWLPTLLEAAGRPDLTPPGLDGVSHWSALLAAAAGRPAAAPREQAVLQLSPPTEEFTHGTAVLRSGRWKLLVGRPGGEWGVRKSSGDLYYDGWATPDGMLRIDKKLSPGRVWLFDVIADPSEEHDLVAKEPGVVQELLRVLRPLNASCPKQHYWSMKGDSLSDPFLRGGFWSPWQAAPAP